MKMFPQANLQPTASGLPFHHTTLRLDPQFVPDLFKPCQVVRESNCLTNFLDHVYFATQNLVGDKNQLDLPGPAAFTLFIPHMATWSKSLTNQTIPEYLQVQPVHLQEQTSANITKRGSIPMHFSFFKDNTSTSTVYSGSFLRATSIRCPSHRTLLCARGRGKKSAGYYLSVGHPNPDPPTKELSSGFSEFLLRFK